MILQEKSLIKNSFKIFLQGFWNPYHLFIVLPNLKLFFFWNKIFISTHLILKEKTVREQTGFKFLAVPLILLTIFNYYILETLTISIEERPAFDVCKMLILMDLNGIFNKDKEHYADFNINEDYTSSMLIIYL